MNKKYILLLIPILSVIIYSCKKNSTTEQEIYNPTPATLHYPSFVDSNIGSPVISTDNPLTTEGIALGRRLFYDKTLSNDMTMSCNSCHNQNNSFDDYRQFSQGTNGSFGKRNAMPIVNMAWNDRFFWDGRRSSLEGQAHDPVVNPIEMANTWPVVVQRLQSSTTYPELFFKAFGTKTIDSDLIVKAIAQFEKTLISFNSLYDRVIYLHTDTFTTAQANGYTLFQTKHCITCHSNVVFTDHTFRNNGLDLFVSDSGLADFTHLTNDAGKFKVPSLRNIAITAPYMHDGRFTTLDQVVAFYNKGVNHGNPHTDFVMQSFNKANEMTIQEQAYLVSFLETLTDSSYITNTQYMPQ